MKISSSLSVKGKTIIFGISTQVSLILLSGAFIANPAPLMKIFVSPAKEAIAIPVGSSD